MNCRVTVEAAVPVYDVATPDEAIRIGISKVGKSLNPDLNYVEIEPGQRTSPDGEELEPAFIVADEALVALELEMDVFSVEGHEHASRIARKEIGQRLENVPLEVIDVSEITDEGEPVESDEGTQPEPATSEPAAEAAESDAQEEPADPAAGDLAPDGDEAADEEMLPEFEDMV
jgi:uncharacterized protein (UPF0212 family)